MQAGSLWDLVQTRLQQGTPLPLLELLRIFIQASSKHAPAHLHGVPVVLPAWDLYMGFDVKYGYKDATHVFLYQLDAWLHESDMVHVGV